MPIPAQGQDTMAKAPDVTKVRHISGRTPPAAVLVPTASRALHRAPHNQVKIPAISHESLLNCCLAVSPRRRMMASRDCQANLVHLGVQPSAGGSGGSLSPQAPEAGLARISTSSRPTAVWHPDPNTAAGGGASTPALVLGEPELQPPAQTSSLRQRKVVGRKEFPNLKVAQLSGAGAAGDAVRLLNVGGAPAFAAVPDRRMLAPPGRESTRAEGRSLCCRTRQGKPRRMRTHCRRR